MEHSLGPERPRAVHDNMHAMCMQCDRCVWRKGRDATRRKGRMALQGRTRHPINTGPPPTIHPSLVGAVPLVRRARRKDLLTLTTTNTVRSSRLAMQGLQFVVADTVSQSSSTSRRTSWGKWKSTRASRTRRRPKTGRRKIAPCILPRPTTRSIQVPRYRADCKADDMRVQSPLSQELVPTGRELLAKESISTLSSASITHLGHYDTFSNSCRRPHLFQYVVYCRGTAICRSVLTRYRPHYM